MKRIIVFFIVLFAAAALAATEPGKDSGQTKPEDKAQTAPATGEDSREKRDDIGFRIARYAR